MSESRQRSGAQQSGVMGRVLILVQDAEAESLFLSFVQSVCPGDGVVLRLSLEQSLDYLQKREVPSYIILDIAGAADPVACVRDVTGMIPPSVTLMIIGDREDVNFYRTITHAFGVAEYLYRPLVENLVVRFFGEIILHGQKSCDTANGGSLVLLTGVRDGVGVSTVLANLSWYVAEVVKRHTLLVDFDLQASKLGLLLNAENNPGLQAVLEAPDRMDGLLIERSTQELSDRLHLLASVGSIMARPVIAPATVSALMEHVRGQFHFIMVESSWRDGDMYAALQKEAQQLVFVLDPTLISVRDTLRAMAALPKGTLPKRPLFVLNGFGRPGTLSLAEVSSSLDMKPDIVVPYLPRECGEAEINGRPLVEQNMQYQAAIMQLARIGLSVHVPDRAGAGGWRGRLGAYFSRLRRT